MPKSIIFLITYLVISADLQILQNFAFNFNEHSFKTEYDFIIIGGGSGGSVVANRLSENPEWSVLLLEAGEDETNFLSDVPILAALQSSSRNNWGYKTVKMKTACLGLKESRCNQPRGKVLGGTSVINFLIYTRGNKEDYNSWGQNNPGWSYNDVLKYFKKSENCTKCTSIDEDYHNYNGYLNIENPNYHSILLDKFVESGQELGYKNNDPNGKEHLGFSKVQATMVNGRRCSANKAFLKPIAASRPGLQISTKSRVIKILFDQSRKARAVLVIKNKTLYKIQATKEVILSAGTFNSPQLLMLSGVGPEDHLSSLQIPIIKALPVGYNLQDHLEMTAIEFLINQSLSVSDNSIQNPADIFNFLLNSKGPYVIPGGALGLGFVRTKRNNFTEDYPDIELVIGAGGLSGDTFGTLRGLLGFPDESYERVFGRIKNKPAFGIATILMRPRSRGRVMLKDSNPLHWPLIIPNYLQEEEDVEVMIEGIKMAIKVGESNAFKDLGVRLHDVPLPHCENFKFGSDEYWRCAVRQVASSIGHQSGTCKMGPEDDPESVVDHRLRIHGVKNIRVVDASIMPHVIAGHTNSVVMMIAEKASDMIKEDWS